MAIVMKAPADSCVYPDPYWPTKDASLLLSGATSSVPDANVSAKSKSFHTHKNWKIAIDAIPGIDSGKTIRRKIVKWFAPSTYAASIKSRGKLEMKLCNK